LCDRATNCEGRIHAQLGDGAAEINGKKQGGRPHKADFRRPHRMTGLNNSDGEWFEEKGLDIRMPGAIADRNSIGARPDYRDNRYVGAGASCPERHRVML